MGKETEVTHPRRVVLDTNVVVSALLFRNGHLAWLRRAWETGHVVPVVSAQTVGELVRVLAYPKFELTEEETKNVLASYMEHAQAVEKIDARIRIPECRDPDDRILLRLAYAARVDALTTGDKDLLELADASRILILTPDALKRALRL